MDIDDIETEFTPLTNKHILQSTLSARIGKALIITINLIYMIMSIITLIVSISKYHTKCCNNTQLAVLLESLFTFLAFSIVSLLIFKKKSIGEFLTNCLIVVSLILLSFCFTFLGIGLSLVYPYETSIKQCKPALFNLFFAYLNIWWILMSMLVAVFLTTFILNYKSIY